MRARRDKLLGACALLLASCATAARHPPCKDSARLDSANRCVPEAWFCSPLLYAGGPQDGCDCNCGASDPDCGKKAKTFWCYGMGMARQVSHCALCDAAPEEELLRDLITDP